jgi:hypothetical protein
MSYYLRFLLTDDDITLATLEAALKSTDPAYAITEVHHEPLEHGLLTHKGDLYGNIEISRFGSAEDEELEELREDVQESGSPKRKRPAVLQMLNEVKAMVVTLTKIDPLWEWLFANRTGMLQADGEGYYDRSGLVLKVE